jgi:uncharacterized Zn-binding protein involved in type VI secretion
MGMPVAKLGDTVVAVDIHIILVPAIVPVPTPFPHPFNGMIDSALSPNVFAMKMPVATLGSIAHNVVPHIPMGPGPFAKPPTNMGNIITGSPTVMVNGKPVARNGDTALTCNDPVDLPVGTVVAVGTVFAA